MVGLAGGQHLGACVGNPARDLEQVTQHRVGILAKHLDHLLVDGWVGTQATVSLGKLGKAKSALLASAARTCNGCQGSRHGLLAKFRRHDLHQLVELRGIALGCRLDGRLHEGGHAAVDLFAKRANDAVLERFLFGREQVGCT